LKITEVNHKFGFIFPRALSLTKSRLSYILGDFFTNPSGQPDWRHWPELVARQIQ
jgi:hypothetical protein